MIKLFQYVEFLECFLECSSIRWLKYLLDLIDLLDLSIGIIIFVALIYCLIS